MTKKHILYDNKPLIWPLPNRCSWGEGFYYLGKAVSLSADKIFAREAELFISQLGFEGISAQLQECGGNIRLLQTCEDCINEEGYMLDITPEGIVLKARTDKGCFYGLQSLMQLICYSPDSSIPAVSITDSPFKAVRGMHMYVPPKKGIDWFKRFVDFLAKYKYNTIYMEIGASVKFDSHPEINTAWESFCREMLMYPGGPDGYGMQMSVGHFKDSVHIENGGGSYLEKSDIRELVEYISSRHIEIIPEVQSLSHAYWMLMPHRECAERQDDPYPDTYCPSNPQTYEIYFECLQEIVDLFKPKTVHIGHDEFYSIGICEKCRSRTGHDILAEDIKRIHDWLAQRGIKTAVWSDKLFEYVIGKENGMACGGRERLNFNRRIRKNELMKATYRAVDMIPNDIIIMDWYHSLSGEDTGSQDYFYRRGMNVVFSNFDDIRSQRYGIPNLEDRLRRPNVLGAECSLWQEVSDTGLAMKDALVYLLEAANILWYEGYRLKLRYGYNRIIAELYPYERNKMNCAPSCALDSGGFTFIDLSGVCNIPLTYGMDYSFIKTAEPIHGTVPFQTGIDSCVLIGEDGTSRIEGIKVEEKLRAISFLHTYTANLGGAPLHACTYVGPEEDIVGYYIIEYENGMKEKAAIEYSRTITSADREFGAHWADPAYQEAKIAEAAVQGIEVKTISISASFMVIFIYEWRNPHPDKVIRSIACEHNRDKKGGIAVFAITGII